MRLRPQLSPNIYTISLKERIKMVKANSRGDTPSIWPLEKN